MCRHLSTRSGPVPIGTGDAGWLRLCLALTPSPGRETAPGAILSVTGSGNCVLTVATKGQRACDFQRNVEKKAPIIVQKDMSAPEFRERLELVRLDIHVLVEAIDFVGGHKFPGVFRKMPVSRESSVGPILDQAYRGLRSSR